MYRYKLEPLEFKKFRKAFFNEIENIEISLSKQVPFERSEVSEKYYYKIMGNLIIDAILKKIGKYLEEIRNEGYFKRYLPENYFTKNNKYQFIENFIYERIDEVEGQLLFMSLSTQNLIIRLIHCNIRLILDGDYDQIPDSEFDYEYRDID